MAYNPKDIAIAIASLCPGLQIGVDFELVDLGDGKGPFISVWHRADVHQPAMPQIQAVDTDALLKADFTFYGRDLLSQFLPADYAAVMAAVAGNAALGLLWAAFLAQGDAPISVSSDRFKQGWATLSGAVGATRAAAIAAAVGIPS